MTTKSQKKDVRPQFDEAEYAYLSDTADYLGVSLKQLVHDRALGRDIASKPLPEARKLAEEISNIRRMLNVIIRRETGSDIRLYEDDVIRLELAMTRIEQSLAAYISTQLRRW